MTATTTRTVSAADVPAADVNAIPAIPNTPGHDGAAAAVWDALTANTGATTMTIANVAGVSRSTTTKALTAFESAGKVTRTPGTGTGRNRTGDTWAIAAEIASPDAAKSDEDVTVPTPEPIEEPDGTAEPDATLPVPSLQDAMKILAGEADRRAGTEAELRKAQAEEEARRAKIDAELRKARTQEETRRALAELLTAVTTTYAAVISGEEEAVTAGLEKIYAEATAVRRAARTATSRTTAGTRASGDRNTPRPLRPLVEAHLASHAGKEFTPGEIAKVLERSPGAVSNALDTLVGAGVAELTCEQPRRFRLAAVANAGKGAETDSKK